MLSYQIECYQVSYYPGSPVAAIEFASDTYHGHRDRKKRREIKIQLNFSLSPRIWSTVGRRCLVSPFLPPPSWQPCPAGRGSTWRPPDSATPVEFEFLAISRCPLVSAERVSAAAVARVKEGAKCDGENLHCQSPFHCFDFSLV